MRSIVCGVVWCLSVGTVQAGVVGVVTDGEGDWHFEERTELFQRELAGLMEDSEPPEFRVVHGEWTAEGIRQALKTTLADSEVDVVYTAGAVASMIARALPEGERTKPVLGGAVIYSQSDEYPITEDGTSPIPNFTYISSPSRVADDLALAVRLRPTDTVYVFIDALMLAHLPNRKENQQRFEERVGVKLAFVEGKATAASYLDQLPDGVTSVYLSLLGRLGPEERKALFIGLQERGIVSVAMAGERDVAAGALAGLSGNTDSAVARRLAISVYHLLEGGKTIDLQVALPVEDRLVLDLSVGEKTGWSPTYDLVLEARLLGDQSRGVGEALTLTDAMQRAADQSSAVAVARAQLDGQRAAERQVRGQLRPQLGLRGDHGWTEISNRIDPAGPDATQGGSYGGELSLILYNDTLRSQWQAARAGTRGRTFAQEVARLDAMETAGIAFVNLLLNQALYEVARENFQLTENNLRLARLRETIGAADQAEAHRWESNAASDQAAMIRQHGAVKDAMAALNRSMGLRQNQVWRPVAENIGEDGMSFWGGGLNEHISTLARFEAFRRLMQEQAVAASPELAQFETALEAQGYTLRRAKRQRYVPEVAGVSTWLHKPQGSNLGPDDSQDEFFVGLTIRLPLFEGGAIRAEIEGEAATLRELEAQHRQALEFVEEQSVAAWNGLAAQHPSIRLSEKALAAARKNYEAVRSKYAEGAATNLDLLDAQSVLLRQEQEATQALHSYLIYTVRVQRVLALFGHEMSEAEQDAWRAKIGQYVEEATATGETK